MLRELGFALLRNTGGHYIRLYFSFVHDVKALQILPKGQQIVVRIVLSFVVYDRHNTSMLFTLPVTSISSSVAVNKLPFNLYLWPARPLIFNV